MASRPATKPDGMSILMDAVRSTTEPKRQQDRPAAPTRPSPTAQSHTLAAIGRSARAAAAQRPAASVQAENEPYHLNIYAHKHNMHITFTRPSRDTILSYSAGNLGLRKAQRASFDAAYQLAAYTMRKMMEKNWREQGKKGTGRTLTMGDVGRIEVVLRGFGPGREAFTKALLGPEGRLIKRKVIRVTDATRLKFGGVRSSGVRRLG